MRCLLLTLLLGACATTASAPAPTAAPIVAAERAFAADAAERGWVAAFRATVAPDAIILRPDIVSAPAVFAAARDDGDRSLQWWPAYAGIARSGDLGFTTGPAIVEAGAQASRHYFTIWRLQADGTWKWIFDGGVAVADAHPIDREATVPLLAVAVRGSASAQAAIAKVSSIESELTVKNSKE